MTGVGSLLEVSRSEDGADFEWCLRGSEIERLRRRRRLRSPPLSFGGTEWQWMLQLDRSSSPLTFRLFRCRPVPVPAFRYWLGELKADGGREEEEIGRGTMVPVLFSSFHPWLLISDLRRRMGRSSDVLRIIIRFRSGPETDDERRSLLKRKQPASSLEATAEKKCKQQADFEDTLILKQHFKKLLLHANDHDVTVTVKEKKFKAHKSVLRARSPVFEAMFTHQMKENEEDTVTIDDVDPDCFDTFLTYVYTGEVEDLSTANAMGLFYTADKYDFPVLKRRCVDVLKASLSTTLVCDVITMAVTHGEEELLESAMDYVTEHLVQIMETVEWQRFALRNPIQANEVSLKAIKRRLNSNPK